MTTQDGRRDFLKTAATTAAGIAVGSVLGNHAEAQTVPAKVAPLNQRAILPDGRALTRPEILSTLGLNPDTPVDAWLVIGGCVVNASGLKPVDASRLLQRGILKREQLSPIQLQQIDNIRTPTNR
jgi:hypothetical protein